MSSRQRPSPTVKARVEQLGRTIKETQHPTAPKPQPLHDLAADAYERAVEHGAVATMLHTLFIQVADRVFDGEREQLDDLWEGLAVVAKYLERDNEDLSDALSIINRQLRAEAEKGGPGGVR